jgi:hypothetical protein
MQPPSSSLRFTGTGRLPTIMDLEASGFGSGSYPIEVGVVCDNGQTYCSLIQPQPEWTHWNCSSEAVHGITREILAAHGKPARQVAETLNSLLAGQCVYSDAWGMDSSWLGKLFEYAGVRQTFRLESLRALLSEEQAAIWHPTKDAVLVELDIRRHRASTDALVLQRTYERSRAALQPELATGT